MTKPNNSKRRTRSMVTLATLTLALTLFSLTTPFGFGRTEFPKEPISLIGSATACQFPNQIPSCGGVNLFINEVKYLGRSAANDSFKVEFIFNPTSQGMCLGSVP